MQREQVYKLIDNERDYQDSLRAAERFEQSALNPGEEITLLKVYLWRAQVAFADNYGNEAALDVVRKLTAVAVRCMENHGASARDHHRNLGQTPRVEVYRLIDGERRYQSGFWSELDPINTVADFLLYIERYIGLAVRANNPAKPAEALDIVRKIAGLGVACMEMHGAPERKV